MLSFSDNSLFYGSDVDVEEYCIFLASGQRYLAQDITDRGTIEQPVYSHVQGSLLFSKVILEKLAPLAERMAELKDIICSL